MNNINLIKLFEEGIDHYFKQEWKIALNKFQQSENLEDKFDSRNTTPSQIYIQRCKMFINNPPEKIGMEWEDDIKIRLFEVLNVLLL